MLGTKNPKATYNGMSLKKKKSPKIRTGSQLSPSHDRLLIANTYDRITCLWERNLHLTIVYQIFYSTNVRREKFHNSMIPLQYDSSVERKQLFGIIHN